jgi:thiosulfate/3-mercaptopyruvate sulfurtransferase
VLPGLVVDPRWLVERLGTPGLVVADVRWSATGGTVEAHAAFERGHLPGAEFVDVDRDLAAPAFEGPGRHPLPAPGVFAATRSRLGMGEGVAVVVSDDVGGSVAARLWWMLDAVGVTAALLDGGLDAWRGSLETGAGRSGTRHRAEVAPRPWPLPDIVEAAEVASAIAEGTPVIDVRAGERYRGEVEPLDPVAGHIPGARSLPWAEGLDPSTGRFLPADALAERFAGVGIHAGSSAEARPILHCGSGVTACHGLLAMRLAGLGRGRLYEGSWSDWVSDPSRAVA